MGWRWDIEEQDMREFVGIKSPLDLLLEVTSARLQIPNVFKREALIFKKIGCLPHLDQFLPLLRTIGELNVSSLPDELADHLAYLSEQGILFDAPYSATGPETNLLESDPEYQNLVSIEEPLRKVVLDSFHQAGLDSLIGENSMTAAEMLMYFPNVEPVIAPLVFTLQHLARKLSVQMRVLNDVEAFPLYSGIVPRIPFLNAAKSDVIEVSLKALPLPDETVPWEHIIEYRSDPDSQSKFLAFRNWMSEVARAKLTASEVEEKLEFLINDYRQHMQLHRMKTNTGTVETIVVMSADVLGNFVSLQWGKAAQVLFSLKHRQEALFEAELTAPGREVAYIVKARETFGAAV